MLAKIYLEEWTEGLACIPPYGLFFCCLNPIFPFLCTVVTMAQTSSPTLVDCPFNEIPKQLMRERSPLMKSKI